MPMEKLLSSLNTPRAQRARYYRMRDKARAACSTAWNAFCNGTNARAQIIVAK